MYNVYLASVWAFAGVTPDVSYDLILSFKGFLVSRTILPLTHKLVLTNPSVHL